MQTLNGFNNVDLFSMAICVLRLFSDNAQLSAKHHCVGAQFGQKHVLLKLLTYILRTGALFWYTVTLNVLE